MDNPKSNVALVAENFLLKKEWRTKSIAKIAVTLGGGQMINRSSS